MQFIRYRFLSTSINLLRFLIVGVNMVDVMALNDVVQRMDFVDQQMQNVGLVVELDMDIVQVIRILVVQWLEKVVQLANAARNGDIVVQPWNIVVLVVLAVMDFVSLLDQLLPQPLLSLLSVQRLLFLFDLHLPR